MSILTKRYSVVVAIAAISSAVACGNGRAGDGPIAEGVAQVEQAADSFDLNDTRITAMVQGKFFTSDVVKAHNIDVDTNQGTVTLAGTVLTEQARQEALRLARSVEGVQMVRDQLAVGPTQAAQPAGPVAGGGDARDPNWITTKIHAQYYLHPGLKPWNIDVTTSRDGVVTLAGTIDNDADRKEALRIATQTEGVTDVRDQLQTNDSVATTGKPSSGAAGDVDSSGSAVQDGWTTAKIQSKYFLDTDVKGHNIDVSTKEGVVTLRGIVHSDGERRQAVSMARNTDGVREVRDELRVDQNAPHRDQTNRAAAERDTPGVDDVWITTKIQSEFFIDDQVRSSKIDVSSKGGTVTLSGTVASDEARQAAEQLARDTAGVKSVVNNLRVSGSSTSR